MRRIPAQPNLASGGGSGPWRVLAILLPIAALRASSACSSEVWEPGLIPTADAAVEEIGASEDQTSEPHPPPPDTGPTVRCTIGTGGDPVGLCTQKIVLESMHEAAFGAQTGVVQSWDAISFQPGVGDAGAVIVDVQDAVSYGAALARYHVSAGVYGDTELTTVFDADLVSLVPLVQTQLASLPDAYDGQLYFDLRAMAGGLRQLNKLEDADKIDVIAEARGRAIYDLYYRDLPEAPGSDAGVDGGDGGKEASLEAGADAPFDADAAVVIAGRGIIGRALAANQIEYEPAAVAAASYALIDLASRHATDDPAMAETWQRGAVRALQHLWDNARDPTTGMMYHTLRTTNGGQDELAGDGPKDTLLLEVQATVALWLLRIREQIDSNPASVGVASGWPYLQCAEALIESANGTPGLWDTEFGGYYEGWVPSESKLLTDKPTVGNGRMLAAVHRAAVIGSSPYVGQMTALRVLMMQRFPAHSSLLSAWNGQVAYFTSVPRDYNLDAIDSGAPGSMRYFSGVNARACDVLDDGWFGIAH